MKTKIAWAELHAPLFLAGTNLGQKLDHKVKGGVGMEYDEDKRHLYVTYNGKTARIPETSVLSMVEAEDQSILKMGGIPQRIVDAAFEEAIFAHNLACDAQVSTPMSHVHAGPGAGSTGQEPPKKTVLQEAIEKAQAAKK